MGNLKPLSRKEFIRKLRLLWFEWPYEWGKHQFFRKNSFKITIPNVHSGKELGKPIVHKLCQELKIDTKYFIDL
ncbi:MAG: hypothetical protein ACD_78C00388G0001 [uncultured bacterium (gcode 4)]|uniref:YcfA family protein n=1 Tax=uncultured bacterium (gcode 4) TaxID=1234023 RepID=K1XX01_9BACT|nr:MAG: hypothetical protein ACD_78C00388G0001 [uncultured bacterium (gcode 4)]